MQAALLQGMLVLGTDGSANHQAGCADWTASHNCALQWNAIISSLTKAAKRFAQSQHKKEKSLMHASVLSELWYHFALTFNGHTNHTVQPACRADKLPAPVYCLHSKTKSQFAQGTL